MAFIIEVENIKCGGCANTIRKRVMALPGISDAEIIEALLQVGIYAGYPAALDALTVLEDVLACLAPVPAREQPAAA